MRGLGEVPVARARSSYLMGTDDHVRRVRNRTDSDWSWEALGCECGGELRSGEISHGGSTTDIYHSFLALTDDRHTGW